MRRALDRRCFVEQPTRGRCWRVWVEVFHWSESLRWVWPWVKGTDWADWETTWSFLKFLTFSALMTSISGGAAADSEEGPGWPEPGHEPALKIQ